MKYAIYDIRFNNEKNNDKIPSTGSYIYFVLISFGRVRHIRQLSLGLYKDLTDT